MSHHPTPRNILSALRLRSHHPSLYGYRCVVDSYQSNQISQLSSQEDFTHTMSGLWDVCQRPVFCVRYHPAHSTGAYLAVGDEDGFVSFLRPDAKNIDQTYATRHKFKAHMNAVFDMQWIQNHATQHSGETTDRGVSDMMVTVSGDQTCGGWDVQTGACLFKLGGHNGSVKAVRVQPGQPAVILTAARDGNILLFDLREQRPANPAEPMKPVYYLRQAHVPTNMKTKRKRPAPGEAPPTGSRIGVTSLCFLQPHILLSGCASDSDVRAWDLRSMATRFKRGATILATAPETSSLASSSSTASSTSTSRKKKSTEFEPVWTLGGFRHDGARRYGVGSLTLDPFGQRLLVSSRDGAIRLYDMVSPHPASGRPASLAASPSQTFVGHFSGSFYPKANWSPCGRFISSGSSDGNAYIWDTREYKFGGDRLERASEDSPRDQLPDHHRVRPCKVLRGHTNEVSEAVWNPHAGKRGTQLYDVPFELATCSDDASVKIWHVDRNADEDDSGEIIDAEEAKAFLAERAARSQYASFTTPTRASPSSLSQLPSSTASTLSMPSPSDASSLSSPSRSRRRATSEDIEDEADQASTWRMEFTSSPSPPSDSFSPNALNSAGSLVHASSMVDQHSLSDTRPSAATSATIPSSSATSAAEDPNAMRDTDSDARRRSLSPPNRARTSSSRLMDALNSNNTSALELQLTSSLTVSPNRVQVARNVQAEGRHRRRLLQEAEVDTRSDATRSLVGRFVPMPGMTMPIITPPVAAQSPSSSSSPVSPLPTLTSFTPALSTSSSILASGTLLVGASSLMLHSVPAATIPPAVIIAPRSSHSSRTATIVRSQSSRVKVVPIRGRSIKPSNAGQHVRPIKDFFTTINTVTQQVEANENTEMAQ